MTTKVRSLTDEEKARLSPLLRELHAHVDGCEKCAAAPAPASPADLGADNFCAAGAALYRRWLAWVAGS